MKNVLKIIALSGLIVSASFAATPAAATSWMDDLSVKGSIGFESEYLYRGQALAMDTIVTSVEGAYKLYNGSLYAGVLNHDSVGNSAFSESDFYVGYKLPVYEKFSADVGYTYYWYQQNANEVAIAHGVTPDRRNEIYAGVVYNGLWVNPAAYIYYDFNTEAVTGEVSGKYSLDLAKYGVAKTALDLGAFIGATSVDDVTGGQATKNSAGYAYYGATADVVYSFTKSAAASVGIRYGGRCNNGGSDVSVLYPETNSFYWGAKFTAGF
jgi:uncharacterized protein (TIGR02001 family)